MRAYRGIVHLLVLSAALSAAAASDPTPPESKRAAVTASAKDRVAKARPAPRARPARREDPARVENVRDVEVREIQATAAEVAPGAIVNIGTVVTGCPCEDGPSCSEQVWIVAYRPETSLGLMLSKVGGHWSVGALQQWWLDLESLQARRTSFRSIDAYQGALNALNERFPVCVANAVPANSPAAPVHP